MLDLIYSYLYSFSHPFQFARFIGVANSGRFEHYDEWRQQGIRSFSVWEGILLAWFFHIVASFIFLSIYLIGDTFANFDESFIVFPSSTFFIFWLGFTVITFPLRVGLSLSIWKFAIRIFSLPFVPEDELEKHLDKVVAHSTSSYVITIIPVVGTLLQEAIWALYLFAALKNVYRLSTSQAVMIISFFTGFIFLTLLSIIFAITLLVEYL